VVEVSEILQKIYEGLRDDVDLIAFCNDNYGKKHYCFFGVDNNNPPSEDYYPLVIVYAASRSRGETANNKRKNYVIQVAFGLFASEPVVDDTNKTVYYKELKLVETFRELGENAIYRLRLGNVSTNGDTKSEIDFPYFISTSLITIEQVISSRKPIGKK
jgi:hypothetical protein